MKTPIDYLNDLKEKTGSDYASAKALHTPQTTISAIRRRGQLSDETAIKIADLLGIDRAEILLAATIARSHGETREAWEAITKRFGIAATLAAFALTPGIIQALNCILC